LYYGKMTHMKNNTSKANNLTITQRKGLNLSFDNGYSLSVQIGPYNYCDNSGKHNSLRERDNLKSTTAEMAIIDKDGFLIVWPDGSAEYGDTVGPYIPIADLPKWISYVSSLAS